MSVLLKLNQMSLKLNYKFKKKQLLNQAFIHRSYLNEVRGKNLESNERLEFLGDAVLELIVSLYLYNKYPDCPEGKLTSLRAKLVQTKTLSLAATRLNFGKNLKLSKGEKASGGQDNPSILAGTYESVVGAIFEDGGLKAATDFVRESLILPAEKIFAEQLPQDYKSQLQEIIQAQGKLSPTYKVIASIGPDHNKTFKVGLVIKGKEITQGQGKSKQTAEQNAARKALLKAKKSAKKEIEC